MPFTNEISGGNGSLVRNWIQSQNFVTGVSGWQIKKDGNAEFNNGTFRGSITSGTNPGKHVVINNGATGDAVDVYDVGNNLIFSIDANGSLRSVNPATGQNVGVSAGIIALGNTNTSGFGAAIQWIWGGGIGTSDHLSIFSGHEPGGQDVSIVMQSAVATIDGTIVVNQRNIAGTLVQTDSNTGVLNNVQRTMRITFTTNGTGDGSFNPNLGFTPNSCLVTPTGLTFTVQGTQILIWRDVLSATNCAFRVFSPGGAAFVGTMVADFTFYG